MKLGIDVVAVERLRTVLERSPNFARRFFTDDEIAYCRRAPDPSVRFAGTLAAKEAVVKAARAAPIATSARHVEIVRDRRGAPHAEFRGRRVEISISHDGGFAIAVAAAHERDEHSVTGD